MPVGTSTTPARNSSEVNAKIDNDSNPAPDQHNGGQPIRGNVDFDGKQRSKFITDCSTEHRASLACIEENYEKKHVCQSYFDAYIVCRREEREKRLAQNATRSLWGISVQTPPSKPRLALLTFDLDDTLFPVAQVVEDANTAMLQALWDAGYTEITNDRIVQHTKMIRRKQRKQMTYTQLRKRAIQTELELLRKNSRESIDYDLVTHAFDCWLQARHASAENNLFHGATDMLHQVKSTYPDVCIGAITNGRGNPLSMTNTLAPFFDFCVSGEDDGVHPERKPHRGIFKVSLSEYRKRFPHDISETHIWVHVGDCLANDVGASAKMGAYSVWVELDDLKQESVTLTSEAPKWSTASLKESNSRRKLADKSRCFVAEKITSLVQLPSAIDKILHKAYKDSLLGLVRKL